MNQENNSTAWRMTRLVSFSVLVGIILVIGFLFYQVMISFLLPLFLAAVLVVMFRPVHRWFLIKCKGMPRVAAGLTTAAVMLIVLVPAGIILTTAIIEASALVGKLNDPTLRTKLREQQRKLGLDMRYAEELAFFDASFQHLAESSSQGVTSPIESQAVERLRQSLEAFRQRLVEEGQYAALFEVPAVEKADEEDEGDEDDVSEDSDTVETMTDFDSTLHSLRSAVAVAGSGTAAIAQNVVNQTDINDAAVHYRRFRTELLVHDFRQQYPSYYTDSMRELVARINELANPTAVERDQLKNQVFNLALFRSIGGATSAILVRWGFGIIIIVIAVYFFLADGPAMVSSFMRLSPLDDRHEQELLEEFDRVSRAVVLATLLSAAVQGLLGGIGFWFADVGSVFLLTVLTAVFALIPFVGAAAVWVPVCLYLFFVEQRITAAIALAVYGAAIVSSADNVIKPLVLHGQSNLHPLLALLSVLGGVQALGPIGVLVGPMVVVFLQTLLNILHRELMAE